MTELELFTKRWDVLQEARLKEMKQISEKVDPRQHVALIQHLNSDPFWEHSFDILEGALRELDPDHSYLPENNIQ